MKRREFIIMLGGAAAGWPLAARAQQPALPVIGFLGTSSPESQAIVIAGFRKGLSDLGYVEGRNVAIEYRWAEGQFDRFPALAADLVRPRIAAVFAIGPPAVRAAQAVTSTIPIVFNMGEDPVTEGLVASFNRPGGNVTGVTDFGNQLAGKLLGLLHEIVPKTETFALLINPTHPNADSDTRDARMAANALRRELQVLTASSVRDIEAAFVAMAQLRTGALFINNDPLFGERREQLAALTVRYAIPAIYPRREFPAAGGLMSYGADRSETSRQAGVYVARILRGEKPADLPVQQATRFELIINLKTAKALNLEIPPGVRAIADEVIE